MSGSLSACISGLETNIAIYLPPNYEASGKHYSVLYYLPGYGDSYSSFIRLLSTSMDKSIGTGNENTFIIVSINGQPMVLLLHRILKEKVDTYRDNLKALKGFVIEYGVYDDFRFIREGCYYFSALLNEYCIPHELVSFFGAHQDKIHLRVPEAVIPYFVRNLAPPQ